MPMPILGRTTMKQIARTAVIIIVSFGVSLIASSSRLWAQCPGACAAPACPPVAAVFPVGPCPIFPLTFSDQTTLTWPAAPAACAPLLYDVAVGDLDCLRGTCLLGLSCPACMALEDDDVDLVAVDAAPLLPGQGAWYLVRVDLMSWNSGFASQATDYNPPLAGFCP
jgi:hypothetical protein